MDIKGIEYNKNKLKFSPFLDMNEKAVLDYYLNQNINNSDFILSNDYHNLVFNILEDNCLMDNGYFIDILDLAGSYYNNMPADVFDLASEEFISLFDCGDLDLGTVFSKSFDLLNDHIISDFKAVLSSSSYAFDSSKNVFGDDYLFDEESPFNSGSPANHLLYDRLISQRIC